MRHLIVIALLFAALACTQKPAPVASDVNTPVPAEERLAIAVEYVAVPSMTVYAKPAVDAPVTGSYGLSEAISVLENKGEWKLIRTFNGSGWVRATDLTTPEQAKAFEDSGTPRFYVEPKKVEQVNARGELAYQAKVNTDGKIIEVKCVKNSTGLQWLQDENAKLLQQASFYPMAKKGQRTTFIYEYKIYY
ncbi:MAG: energy transducer TonB [Thermoanaerobaculia bacterium]